MSRTLPSLLVAALLLGSMTAATMIGPAASVAAPPSYSYCPPAKPLVRPSTHFRHRKLARGVSLAETKVGRPGDRLKVNVVRVNLANRHAAVGPLHHAMTTRRRLTQLAARPHLVAATNGTYFDFTFGAPTVPFIGPRGPQVLSRRHTRVAGIGVDGRARDGHAWLVGHAISVDGNHRLGGVNEVAPPRGLSVYTPAWGRTKVPLPLLAQSLAVRRGQTVDNVGRRRTVPHHGYLLVATTAAAAGWLYDIPRTSGVLLNYHAATDAPHRFREAYGVGTQVVAAPHHIRDGLYCSQGEIYAARTDIAWRDGGRQLILATVHSPHGSEGYGVDENQMSEVMVRLGAARSYALDGGGSTELVAQLPGQHSLSIRSAQISSHQRRIPLGIGVYSFPKPRPVWHPHHHKHTKHEGVKPKRCLLGLLPASACHHA